MMHSLIANAALIIGFGVMCIGYRWMMAAMDREGWVSLSISQINRQKQVLHEAIILYNYGAHREAIKLLEKEGFTVTHG